MGRKLGRKTKLTPEVQDKIVFAIRSGNYKETAAQYAGISEKTFYVWLQRGRDEPSSIYADFFEAINHAEAASEVEAVALVRLAARITGLRQ